MNNILPRQLEDEMKVAYLDYTMSVIVGRALPDARDGLKPVHRRVLYAMHELGLAHNKTHRKSALVVGDVLGKYHPHGDSAVYDTMVRMAQDFALRYPLVNGQGNWGSIDGDGAAAMRYTEAKMTRIAGEVLADIDKDTVSFADNYDASVQEPTVLPSKFPNLLVNGSAGIAVGMATNIPPHNMREICAAIVHVLENPNADFAAVLEHVKGPDFPTAGKIIGRGGIVEAYRTGRGKIAVRGTVEVETKKDRERLIVTAIPYQTNKAQLIEQIADGVRNKIIEGISDLRDESNKDGMRIVIDLKRDAAAEIVERNLYRHSRLQQTFGIILLALVDGRPRVLNLRELIDVFIDHRRVVIRRRTSYELRKAEERQHILEGLLTALTNIDAVIALIKKAKEGKEAKAALISAYTLSDVQAQAILDLKLQRLTGLEQQSIRNEHSELAKAIKEYKSILADAKRVDAIVKEETQSILQQYGDERRTVIEETADSDFIAEDLIADELTVITVSHAGYVKRQPIETYKEQGRGGVGVIGATTKEEDWVEQVLVANTHDTLLLFTSEGKVHWLKTYEFPEQGRTAKGKHLANLVNLAAGERVQAFVPVRSYDEGYVLFATEKGTVKKTALSEYSRKRAGGIQAITLAEGDTLVSVRKTTGNDEILLVSSGGMAVRCNEIDIRPMGRSATGVRGISLRGKDKVVALLPADPSKMVLTMTERGYGKRTPLEEYRLIGRGGKGVITMNTGAAGPIVVAAMVSDKDGIITMSKDGTVLRTRVADISEQGRATQGVRVMRLRTGDTLVSAAIVRDE
jgi:DNA gyrase subunit A